MPFAQTTTFTQLLRTSMHQVPPLHKNRNIADLIIFILRCYPASLPQHPSRFVSLFVSPQDVSLMKEFFGLKCKYEDMSPVLIPAGYTRDYIDGKIAAGEQLKDVHEAFQVRAGKRLMR